MSRSEYLLSKKYYRKILLSSGFLSGFLLIFVRFFLVPYLSNQPVQDFTSIFNAVIDNLFAALASSLSITLIILWLLPNPRDDSNVIESAELISVLRESLNKTNYFWYSGHTARWTCSQTLPYLAAEARARDITIRVYITIIDPDNNKACQRYADLRNKIGIEKSDPEVLRKKHRLELFSAIISAYSWKSREPRLQLEMSLSDKVSIFRIDLSSKSAIVTTPGARKPALKFDSSSSFYNLFLEEVNSVHSQSRLLPTEKRLSLRNRIPEADTIGNFLESLSLNTSDLTNDDLISIAKMALAGENPYPN